VVNGKTMLTKELIGRGLLIALSVGAFLVKWWIPLIIAPFFWQVWETVTGQWSRAQNPVLKLIADAVTWVLWIGYIVYSIVSFELTIGHWYGLVLGVVVGLVVAQFFHLLWPHRWHLERLQRDH